MPVKTSRRKPAKRSRAVSKQTILLTGADQFLGKLVLRRLQADKTVGCVLTLGPRMVRGRKVRHVKSLLQDPKLLDRLGKLKVDAVLHLDFRLQKKRDDSVFEHNVLGTLNLLEAAAEVGIRRVVVRSSTYVYGVKSTNPNFIPETRRIRLKGGKTQYIRHFAEMERYLVDFLPREPELRCAILRFAQIVGPTADTPLMKYLKMPSCPTLLGFDPLFQLLHEEDAADAVIHALKTGYRGPVNICPEGVTPLLRILRFLKKDYFSIPHPLLNFGWKLLPALRTLPVDADQLRYTLGGETERMREEFGFTPKRTTSESLHAIKRKF